MKWLSLKGMDGPVYFNLDKVEAIGVGFDEDEDSFVQLVINRAKHRFYYDSEEETQEEFKRIQEYLLKP